jgi:hypothetical protein
MNYPVSQHVFHGSLYVLNPCVTSLSMLARRLANSSAARGKTRRMKSRAYSKASAG